MRRDFPEIKLQTLVTVPPLPPDMFRSQLVRTLCSVQSLRLNLMQPNFNPNFRAKSSMDTEWHTKRAQPAPNAVFSANQYTGSFYPADFASAIIEHPAESDLEVISHAHHQESVDDLSGQLARATSPAQFATDGAADHDAEETIASPVSALVAEGGSENVPTAMPIDGHRHDERTQEALPLSDNLSQLSPLSGAKQFQRASHSTIKLAKVRCPYFNLRGKSISQS